VDSLIQHPHDHDERDSYAASYLLPPLTRLVTRGPIFELGCGNGSVAERFARAGFAVTGVDISDQGIAIARSRGVGRFEIGSAYDDLAARFGSFPTVLSLEVVEHCFFPRKFARTMFDLTEPEGVSIISTPFHGYWKNLALALSGKMDDHYTVLWDGGHIKFWSEKTLRVLLLEAGFERVDYVRAGRIAPLAKSMIAVARKGRPPAATSR
jgi:2-polyprenyl-6-hydroxyphenyl methylase/3-demethylubiquinone-9 3-methyltransferase